MSKKMTLPEFKSEAEEADWWYDNRGKLSDAIAAAAQKGTLKRMTIEQLQQRLSEAAARRTEKAHSKTVTIRLADADLTLARQQAERKGLPYQTYIKTLLHEALQKETS